MGVVPERRACRRKNVMDRRLVTVNLDNTDAGLMVDISEAGIAVQALARIKQGATTFLQFELPDTAARIEAKGTVAWVDTTSGRAGIRFHKLDEAAAASLREWLGSQPSQKESRTSAPVSARVAPLLGSESKVAAVAALQREITARGLDTDAALSFIVERARGLTRADGAAIALGDSKFMTCRAASGSAPPVGTALQPDSGLSGECVRTGMTVRCEDTELDPRVDREACRSLKLRSAVIVPLFARGNISGLVEIFYSSPRGFEGRDVLTLRRMADLISATLCASVPRQSDAPAPVANVAAPNQPPSPEPVHVAPSATMIPPLPRLVSGTEKVVCDVCGHENPIAVKDCEKCDVPLPARLEQEREGAQLFSVVPAEQRRVEAGPTLTQPDVSPQRRRVVLRFTTGGHVLLLIAVLVLAASIWGWHKFKTHRASAAAPVNTTSAADPPVLPAAAPPIGVSEISFQVVQPPSSRVPSSQKSGIASGAKERPPLIAAKNIITTPASSNSAVKSPPAALPIPVPQPVPQPAEPQGVVPPPLLATTPTPIVATILSPPAITPKFSPATVATAKVSSPRLLARVEPVYPKLALASRVQGAVVLKASILRSGRLGQIQVVSGNDLLIGAAVQAVQRWRYKPMELDGKPVESETTIKINFSLGSGR